MKKFGKYVQLNEGNHWIKGWGYDEGKLVDERSPTRWDLDRATTDIPIFISRTCTHIAVVNSKALELAGITKDTPDPQGGRIDRDSNGELTGISVRVPRNSSSRSCPLTRLKKMLHRLPN